MVQTAPSLKNRPMSAGADWQSPGPPLPRNGLHSSPYRRPERCIVLPASNSQWDPDHSSDAFPAAACRDDMGITKEIHPSVVASGGSSFLWWCSLLEAEHVSSAYRAAHAGETHGRPAAASQTRRQRATRGAIRGWTATCFIAMRDSRRRGPHAVGSCSIARY